MKNRQFKKQYTNGNSIDFQFCTECQNQLDEFGVEPEENDVASAKRNFDKCVKTGKFKGDYCAKYFIARLEDEEPTGGDD